MLCRCGCGNETREIQRGRRRGESNLYLNGHSNRGRKLVMRTHYDETKRRADIESRLVPDGECLLWTGTLNSYGYGIASWHARYRLVHILTYEWANGPVPAGHELDHLCRRHNCANPKHLEAVTHRENMLRGRTIAAMHAAKTHCVNGHEFTADNTRIRRGARECRTCTRERQRRNRPQVAA